MCNVQIALKSLKSHEAAGHGACLEIAGWQNQGGNIAWSVRERERERKWHYCIWLWRGIMIIIIYISVLWDMAVRWQWWSWGWINRPMSCRCGAPRCCAMADKQALGTLAYRDGGRSEWARLQPAFGSQVKAPHSWQTVRQPSPDLVQWLYIISFWFVSGSSVKPSLIDHTRFISICLCTVP